MIGMLRAKQQGSSKYFTLDEARETISSKRIYNAKQKREKKENYTF
jgi:hypothetical protein